MKNKILNILLIIFAFMFLIYPTSIALTDIKPIVLISFIILIVTFISGKIKCKKIVIKEKYYLWIIIILATITRIGIVFLLEKDIIQVSDFKTALDASINLDFSSDYHRVFTHWIMLPYLTNKIYKIFGMSQLVYLLTNSIVLIMVAIIIYKISSILFNNKKYGLISSLIYIFWPANIFYTLIYTQEHICQLLLVSSIYLILKLDYKPCEDIKNYKQIILCIIIGLLLGLSVFFKNFAPVFLIALPIFYILKSLKITTAKKYLCNHLVYFILILFSFFITKNIMYLKLDHLAGHEVNRNATPCYLNVGLKGTGTYNPEFYSEYFAALNENDYNYKKTNSIIIERLLTNIKDKSSVVHNVDFWDNKAKILFSSDNSRLDILLMSTENARLQNIINNNIKIINYNYFIIMVAFMAIGLINMIKKQHLELFFLYLVVFGSFLLLILVEAQNRYMYSIQFIFPILAIPGLKILLQAIKNQKIENEIS